MRARCECPPDSSNHLQEVLFAASVAIAPLISFVPLPSAPRLNLGGFAVENRTPDGHKHLA